MNIFVAGFPDSFGRKELGQLFDPHGTVKSAKVIYDRESGQSRCFGFVEMPEEAEGHRAIQELDAIMIEDRKLSVSEARPKKELY